MAEIKQVRAYLWRVRDIERDLKLLEQEYEQAKDDILHLKAIQYDANKVSGGKIGDLSDAIIMLEFRSSRYLTGDIERYCWGGIYTGSHGSKWRSAWDIPIEIYWGCTVKHCKVSLLSESFHRFSYYFCDIV